MHKIQQYLKKFFIDVKPINFFKTIQKLKDKNLQKKRGDKSPLEKHYVF